MLSFAQKVAHRKCYLFESRLTFLNMAIQFVVDFVELPGVTTHILQLFYFHDDVVQPSQYIPKHLYVLCVF